MLSVSLLVILSSLFVGSLAGISNVPTNTILYNSGTLWGKSGVYALGDSPAGSSEPMVGFKLAFTMTSNATNKAPTPLRVELTLFHSTRAFEVGSNDSPDNCCTRALALVGTCPIPNRVIFRPNPSGSNNTLKYYYVNLTTLGEPVPFEDTIIPEISGIWYLYVFNCDPDRSFSISGTITWKSPYGYIPAQSYGNMIVHYVVAGLYFLAIILWVVWLIRFNRNLHRYQHAVTILLIGSMIEELLWGGQYVDYNTVGQPSIGILVPAVIFSAFKLSGVRLLLLLMGLGLSITTPTLEYSIQLSVGILTLCYFIMSAADAYISIADLVSFTKTSPVITWLTGALVVILNVIFIVWIVYSTLKSMQKCKDEKNEKYSMYWRLVLIFGIITTLSCIFFFVEFGLNFADSSSTFRVWWLLSSYWEFIYFAITAFISFVWRPAADNARYAYEVLGGDEPIPEMKQKSDDSNTNEATGNEAQKEPSESSSD